ncbi:MAG: dihydrofolate reductase, partial [Gemmatimonadales bacterium]
DNDLPWRLPDDLKRFKSLTMGHTILMGRRTWESIGRALPGRRTIVLSRNLEWKADGADVAASLDEALAIVPPGEPLFLTGGEAVYLLALPRADVLELTRVHADIPGDAFFPPFDPADWTLISREDHPADERHAFAFSFERYERNSVGATGRMES